MAQKSAIAIGAHPDDIEFCMAGTLLQLRAVGWKIHYFNLSSGNLGSVTMTSAKTVQTRAKEARAAARILKARYHASICQDLEYMRLDKHFDLFHMLKQVKTTTNPERLLIKVFS